MYSARQRELGIKITGQTAHVPNTPMATLMYYLGCIDSLVDFNIPSKLRDYDNYSQLTYEDENQVLCLAVLLSPDVFIEKSIMINEPRLCGNSQNKFYEITDTQTSVAATREFIIGGKRVRTMKLMAFKKTWIEENYIEPMNSYAKRIKAIAEGKPDKYKKQKKDCNIC